MQSPAYIPVIGTSGDVTVGDNLTVQNSLTVANDAVISGDATVSGIFSGGTGGFTGTLTVDSALNANGGLNTSTVSAIEVGIANSPAAFEVFGVRVTNDAQPRLSVTAGGTVGWGSGSATPDTNLYRSNANELTTDDHLVMATGQSNGTFAVFSGGVAALNIGTAGGGITIKQGSNARMGRSTLVGGTVTVANTSVTANTQIFLTTQTLGGTIGVQYVSARVAATSFTITSSSGTDTSTVAWLLVEPS